MPFNVNTNMSSMTAQLNTSKTESSIGKSIQRLSSGLRVNGAADDAAGLAIAKNMSKQVSGYEVNVRNANDAVSLLQVAEGGMDEIGNMLQRMKDLALQSANGTNSTAQRNNMDLEFQQLISEIDRVVATTEFNGLNLLDGSQITNTNFQVDESNVANTDTIQVSIADVDSTALGVNSGAAAEVGELIGATNQTLAVGGTGTSTLAVDNGSILTVVGGTTTIQQVIDHVNSETSVHGISVSFETNAALGGHLAFKNSSAANVNITVGGESVQFGSETATAAAGTLVIASSAGLDIQSETNAQAAIVAIDNAITSITNERAVIGASQNRFDKAINNLNNKIVNVSAAMGRIMDADFAKETAEFSKSQILQQAGVSMMAQAKALPNQLLSLLQ